MGSEGRADTDKRTSLTFGASGSWQRAETARIEHPLKTWGRDYLAGFAQAARDVRDGRLRTTFGSFAVTAFAAGYRAGVSETGKKEGE